MEDSDDMRNQILSELIDKMHGRMADKMYPEDKPPVEETVTAVLEPKDEKAPEVDAEDELSDEDLAALTKESGE